MTEKESFADKVRDHATDDSPHAHQAPDRSRWTDVLMQRWPTALGIVVATLAAFDLEDGLEFAALAVLMPLVYLGAAALDRRWSAWVVLLAGLALAFFIPSTSGVVPSVVLLVAALVFLVLGRCVGNWSSPAASHFKLAGCSPSVRSHWWRSTWSRISVGSLWVSPSSATPLGTLTTICETGWSPVRTLSSVPFLTSCWGRPSSS